MNLQMPIPSRLANDGWWLCESPSTALVCKFPIQRGSAKMADFTTPASNASSVQDNPFPVKPVVAFALAALADWLFYGQRIGISALLFAIALACGSLLANFARLDRRQISLAGILVLAGLVPAVEEFNAASLFFIALALGVGLLLTTNRHLTGVGEQATAFCDLYLLGPFRFLKDAISVFNLPALA